MKKRFTLSVSVCVAAGLIFVSCSHAQKPNKSKSTTTSSTSRSTSTSKPKNHVTSPTSPPTKTTTSTSTSTSNPSNLPKVKTETGYKDTLFVFVTSEPYFPKTGQTVTITIHASEHKSKGEMYYNIDYGDGQKGNSSASESCISVGGPTLSKSWILHHKYANKGGYHVSINVMTHCDTRKVPVTYVVSVTTAS